MMAGTTVGNDVEENFMGTLDADLVVVKLRQANSQSVIFFIRRRSLLKKIMLCGQVNIVSMLQGV